MFGVSAGVGTSAIATSVGVAWTRQTNTDPMIGVLGGAIGAIALSTLLGVLFLFKGKNG